MTYDEISKLSEQLSYRDKFRLAQLLIQLARKEEEEQYPEARKAVTPSESEVVQYVAERLLKLRPTKKASLLNSVGAMFQFQGGISDADKEQIIMELQKQRRIAIDQNGRVSYPEQ
ncbi:MAG: hypothetical protein HT580_09700 [Dechloromonas sp.]|nr:MAG: hypothetical protein HT580_09700 [Dechloromonas sp.]